MDMVTNVTNFSRSGLYDRMAQRVSAVVLAAYVLFLLGYIVLLHHLGRFQNDQDQSSRREKQGRYLL